MATCVNKYKEEYDIYIGRGSKWGNPFSWEEGTKAAYKVATREEAIECYRQYLWHQIHEGHVTLKQLQALDGTRLGCFCKPKSCHGDIIVKAVEWARGRTNIY